MTSQPPPWIVAVPDEPGEPPPSRNRRGLLVVLAGVVVVLVVAGMAVLAARRFRGEPDPEPAPIAIATVEPTYIEPEPTIEPTTEPTTPPTTFSSPTPDPEDAALAQLEELSAQGLAQVTLNGQLVAQLASKTPGIADPRQTAADGTHVFQATDILREHQTLRDDPRNGDATVLLLRSTDYGKRQLYRGEPLFVTFAVRDFADPKAVRAWCARRFPELTGEDLANQCAVRRLTAP